jgi:ATP phosphoribosyltransferase
MTLGGGLTIAVPRGHLFAETVELLARLGLDTTELRSNDRKLLFEDIGVITMRPSDVPTYVEAGAADLGITGSDVLLEQSHLDGEHGREVYELLDLGYGRATMVLATEASEPSSNGASDADPDAPARATAPTAPTATASGELAVTGGDDDPAARVLRRLGVVRVATKYPRIAAQHMVETGRQAEIVEVHGSVELAPLAGLAEAIIDLTATGTTLRENNLVVREQIAVCTARLIANPVAHKLKAQSIDELLGHIRTSP